MTLLEEYDSLQMTMEQYESLSTKERLDISRKREDLLRKMSDEDIKVIISRNVPIHYKIFISKLRKELK